MSDEAKLAELVAGEREAMVPDAAIRAGNLAGLEAAIDSGRAPIGDAPPPPGAGSGGGAEAGSGSGSGVWIGVGLLAAVAIVATIVTLRPSSGDAPTPSAAVEPAPVAEDDEPAPALVTTPHPTAAPEAEDDAPPTATSSAEPELESAAATDTGVADEPASTTGSKPRRRARDTTRGDTGPADADNTCAEELRALKNAKRLSDTGKPEAALSVLDRAAKKFGKGSFDEERRALRVQCLCAAGRKDAARAAADKFFADFPASPQTERVRHACD